MSASSIPQIPRIDSLDGSRFMQRLIAAGMHANVVIFAEKAKALLSTINANMPLYTLHDERHILNVLAWMEWLAGDVIDQLAPVECALCILAAYAHDLGMTLTPAEEAALCAQGDSPEQRKYQQFLDGFVEEKHEIERLSRSTDSTEKYSGRLLEQHLLTEFLRRTHSDTMAVRMKTRIQQIIDDSCNSSLLKFGTLDFKAWLELIALSHNQSTDWLRETLNREGGFQCNVDRQPVNGAFVGLLLRLADIMDFDASRTPTILFHHLGLDRSLGSRFVQLSQHEWKKHLAISGTPVTKPADDWTLTYEALQCDHPAVDKSIREFVGWIEREVRLCREELEFLLRHCDHKHYALRLPLVKHNIQPRRDRGVPVYVFEDWRFQLHQQEIIQLLMGESLYGEPSLCIRELLQNSLDALELRDLRLQLPKAERRESTDGVRVTGKPGYFRDDDDNEKRLEVRLTWGREPNDGPWWIKIEDNGVGMTPAVIGNFFTQLGKSFYRSADFESEKALLRRNGLLATPISQFGIGVLSCFMIADRVEVRTCPGGAVVEDHQHPRRPTDLTISGPGSLFWSKPGTRLQQGTEIKLILRRTMKGKPVSLSHDASAAVTALREHFGYNSSHDESDNSTTAGQFDPAFIAAQHVVWPKYPVIAGDSTWEIDDTFHGRVLAPLDIKQLTAKANEWDIPLSQLGRPTWHYFDWVDNGSNGNGDASEVTGSRIRIWFARPDSINGHHSFEDAPDRLKLSELAAFVEPQLEFDADSRCRVLVKGMGVRQINCLKDLVKARVGSRVWIDLRGSISPRLTADRQRAFVPERADDWPATVAAFSMRLEFALAHAADRTTTRTRNLLTLVNIQSDARRFLSQRCPIETTDWDFPQRSEIWRIAKEFETDVALDGLGALARDGGVGRALALVLARDGVLTVARDLARDLAPDSNCYLALDLDLGLASDLARDLDLGLAWALDSNRTRNRRFHGPISLSFPIGDVVHLTGFLQGAYGQNLSASWPSFELFALNGLIGDARMTAPASCCFELESDQRTVSFADRDGAHPQQLINLGYDLCYPLPSIPLGRLRRDCSSWRTDRRFQALGTMPLLFPSYCDVWPKHCERLRELFGVQQVYALMPVPDLWHKPFAEWSYEDWANPQHLSILWNIETGDVHFCGGIQTPEETAARGETYKAVIKQIDREP